MDAHALLSSQGWRGKGHSLHQTDDSIGLQRPILVSKKNNTKGLGQKQHFTSDQWWMNAFDEQLKGLDTSKEGHVVQTIKTGKLNAVEQGSFGKYALYASFVRGGYLEGTIKMATGKDSSTTSSDSEDDSDKEIEAPKTQQAERVKETKEERRQRKEAKRRRKELRALRRAARAERRSKSKKTDTSDSTDEEKRERRARKEEKRRQRKEKESKSKGS